MEFIGQSSIVEDFGNKIKNNKLGHAYILTGEPGIGKRTLARYLAKTILCTDRKENQAPCGNCRACKTFDVNVNPNFTVVRHETRSIVIKQIRNMLEDIEIRPSEGKKVYIIEEADRMTTQAQNCILKTLEEPPPYAVIILTTAIYDSLLITIKSRAVQVSLKPYSLDEMREILNVNRISFADKEYLLSLSQGIPGKTINLIDDKDFEESRNKVMSFLFDNSTMSAMEFNKYLSDNKEAFSTCMDIIDSVYHDALMVLYSIEDGLINPDKKDNIIKYANEHSTYSIMQKISRIQEIRLNLKRNLNYQLAVDIVTLEI